MDRRSTVERWAWNTFGPPLYYCECCLRAVTVTTDGPAPTIVRPCDSECDGARIIAPRKAIVAGKGGLSPVNKAKMAVLKAGAAITGRCV